MFGKVALPQFRRGYESLNAPQRQQLWYRILPYILEPRKQLERRKIDALCCAWLIAHYEQKIASLGTDGVGGEGYVKLRTCEEERLSSFGGWKALIKSPSDAQVLAAYKKNSRDYHTVYAVVWYFLRLAESGCNTGVWASLDRARGIIKQGGFPTNSVINPYRTEREVGRAWNAFRPVCHLIFGIVSAVPDCSWASSRSQVGRILQYASFSQQELFKIHVRNMGGRAAFSPNDLWLLPKQPELVALRPELLPLDGSEIKAFQLDLEKQQKKAKGRRMRDTVDDPSP